MLSLKLSIRLKIIFSFLSLVLFIIAVFTFASYFRTVNALQTEILEHGKKMVKIFTQMASPYVFENDYQTLLDNSNKLIEDSDILLVTVMDIHGRVWINTAQNQPGIIEIEPFYADSINNITINHREIRHAGQSVMEFVSPIVALGKVMYLLRIEFSLEKRERQAAERVREIILISLGMIIFATFLGIFLSKRLTDPLKKLVKGTHEISKGNLDYKIQTTSLDEIGILTESFNRMTDNLKKEVVKLKQAEEKIEKARNDLEIRVNERTAELQKEMEDRIVAEEKYQKLMEASPVPIVVYDMEGNTVYINPAFIQTFGWTLEEFQGKEIDFIPESELPQTLKILEQVKQNERYTGFDTRRYNKQKQLLDVSISFDSWRGQDGTPRGSVVILHDVTKRKQLEIQLLQARKMEAVGTLAGGIAHDFNNILSGIYSYSQLAERHIETPEKAKNHIRQIFKGAQRAAELVQQILTFSRQTEYQKHTLQLSIVLKEVLKLVRSSIPTTIEIKEEIHTTAMVLADPIQMHQVIMNLCTNAYHAMREKGGVLTVVLNEINVPEKTRQQETTLLPGTYLQLEVKDTGHGMDKEILEKAFDPYFTTKDVGKGTGFGLSLVQAIVEEHDGHVTAVSVPGQGSSFYVYLPVVETGADPYTEPPREQGFVGGKEKILVVDDEESIRTGIHNFLEDCGYEVSSFQNGLLAFQEFEKDPSRFDLVLTDMTMPQMAGDELSARILKIRKELPIILCTGYSENISETRAVEIGIYKYVQKPVLAEELALLIREALDGGKFR